MATLLQRLGLVAGLGLTGVVSSGCEQRIDVDKEHKIPSKVCADGRDHFVESEEHVQRTYLLGMPIRSRLIRTVGREYSCKSGYLNQLADEVHYLISKGVVYPNGNALQLSAGEDVDPVTGKIVDNTYRGGSSL